MQLPYQMVLNDVTIAGLVHPPNIMGFDESPTTNAASSHGLFPHTLQKSDIQFNKAQLEYSCCSGPRNVIDALDYQNVLRFASNPTSVA